MAKIPHDDWKEYRLNKFVDYQHRAKIIYLDFMKYCKDNFGMSDDDFVYFCFLFCLTYNEVTALILYYEIDRKNVWNRTYLDGFWKANKKRLVFSSARKRSKNTDTFAQPLSDFYNILGARPNEKLRSMTENCIDTYSRYDRCFQIVTMTDGVGDFSGHKFLEPIEYYNHLIDGRTLADIEFKQPDWATLSWTTLWCLRIANMDESAERFDKTGKLTQKDREGIETIVLEIERRAREKYWDYWERGFFLPKACSFGNLWKNSRYGGYHHDRQLEHLLEYKKTYQEQGALIDKMFEMRKAIYPNHMLWELHGWTWIRPERKHLWTRYWLTWVE